MDHYKASLFVFSANLIEALYIHSERTKWLTYLVFKKTRRTGLEKNIGFTEKFLDFYKFYVFKRFFTFFSVFRC